MPESLIVQFRKLEWSYEKIAVELGVSFNTVCNWMAGRNEPSPMAMDRIEKLMKKIENKK